MTPSEKKQLMKKSVMELALRKLDFLLQAEGLTVTDPEERKQLASKLMYDAAMESGFFGHQAALEEVANAGGDISMLAIPAIRPPSTLSQSSSPFGLADELRGIQPEE